jgi:hypothetical protein
VNLSLLWLQLLMRLRFVFLFPAFLVSTTVEARAYTPFGRGFCTFEVLSARFLEGV